MGVRTSEDTAVEEARRPNVGAIESATGYLVDAVMANGAAADLLVLAFLTVAHALSSRITAAASSTARMILS